MNRFQENLSNADYLKQQQYNGTNNLQKRSDLHRLYSVGEAPWFTWVLAQLNFDGVSSVLECGAGGGWLWQHNLARLPRSIDVTLTDLTDGMVSELQQLADGDERFSAEPADIQSLPFDYNQFDMIIANHMLYHVPDIARAIAEVRRVLRPNGTFYAVTNGQGHLQELDAIGKQLAPDSGYSSPGARLPFNLENGAEWLSNSFSQVILKKYQSELQVTDPSAITTYLSSLLQIDPDRRVSTEAELQRQIDTDGHVHITKATGMFTATN